MWSDFLTMSSDTTFFRLTVVWSLTGVPKGDDLCLIVRGIFEG